MSAPAAEPAEPSAAKVFVRVEPPPEVPAPAGDGDMQWAPAYGGTAPEQWTVARSPPDVVGPIVGGTILSIILSTAIAWAVSPLDGLGLLFTWIFVPAGGFVTGACIALNDRMRRKPVEGEEAKRRFRVLAVSAAALAVVVGLFVAGVAPIPGDSTLGAIDFPFDFLGFALGGYVGVYALSGLPRPESKPAQ